MLQLMVYLVRTVPQMVKIGQCRQERQFQAKKMEAVNHSV